MSYYKVWVAYSGYHGQGPLTYESGANLPRGTVVRVSLQKREVLGWVDTEVSKPDFATKSVSALVSDAHLPQQLIALHAWMIEYYPAPLGQITSLFLPTYLSIANHSSTDILEPLVQINNPELTSEQEAIIITLSSKDTNSALIHGVTGSGKTMVYAHLAAKLLGEGKSSLVLTPEIGLTPQLASNISTYTGKNALVIHSGLTVKQRAGLWYQIANATEPLTVVGPRSALFSPIKNLGLIVVDEFHDQAYKQGQAPHYLTTRVAAKLASLHKAKLVMGSATPPIDIYYTFRQKGLPILDMTKSAVSSSHKQPEVEVVSLKDRALFDKSAWLSSKLLDQVSRSLDNREQSLIFLNRRGTAKLALCQTCGWQALCPKCDIPLTYHGDGNRLLCHTCGHKETAPTSCPVCGSAEIIFKGVGTKLIASELSRLFPSARLLRFDGDNKKSERFDQAYEQIRHGNVDILVGTQILTKGLDLPRLSCVGIVVADSALSFPDFSAEEKTFQMLNQVMGRVGRGHIASNIVLQTYNPNSPTIMSAVSKDYAGFYESQLRERESFNFPPFVYLMKLSISKSSQSSASKASQRLADTLHRSNKRIEIDGPSPALVEKAHGKYNWQIVIKSKSRAPLLEIVSMLSPDWSYDIDPVDLI